MIQNIREWTTSWVAWGIIMLVCASFALWGVHSYFDSPVRGRVVANVNGEKISNDTLNKTYRRLRRSLELQFQNKLTVSQAMEATLKKQALQNLIHTTLLTQDAQKQGYVLLPGQTNLAIRHTPAFQVDGAFSEKRYQQYLNFSGDSHQSFVSRMEKEQLIDQIKNAFQNSEFVLSSESDVANALVNQLRNVAYIQLPLKHFTVPAHTITEKALRAYYKQHKQDFTLPEQVSIHYIELSMSDIIKTITPDQTTLRAFFQDNLDRYTGKEGGPQKFSTVEKQVLNDYKHEQAQKKFDEASEELTNITFEQPDSLEPAAKALGLTIQETPLFSQKEKGTGLTGNPVIVEAAFSEDVLKNSNNSSVISLNSDAQIVLRVKKHNPKRLQAFYKIKPKIQAALTQKKQENRLKSLAEAMTSSLDDGSDAAHIAAKQHLTSKNIGFIARTNTKTPKPLVDAAFSIHYNKDNPKNNEKLIKLDDEHYAFIIVQGVKADTNKNPEKITDMVSDEISTLAYRFYVDTLMTSAKIIQKGA